MSFASRNPLRFLGGCPTSGAPDDGSLATRQGGTRVASLYSGGLATTGPGVTLAAGHAVIATGQGRINTVIPHQSISGVQIFFYDSAIAARSGVGTIPESGYKILGTVNANSFYAPNTLGGPLLLNVDMPYTSGIAVSAASGAPGFSVSWTPAIPGSGITNAG